MGLPVSGFPNMNAVSLEDATGVNYVDTTDFLKVGVLGSIMAYGEQAPRVCARALCALRALACLACGCRLTGWCAASPISRRRRTAHT
jgi:hypothetical protein